MLVTLVGFAFLFGILISRMGLPPMVGFLVAGFAYNFAGLEAPTGLQLVADLGVTLLLFLDWAEVKTKRLGNLRSLGYLSPAYRCINPVLRAGHICGPGAIPNPDL